jgi:hypothetical protein
MGVTMRQLGRIAVRELTRSFRMLVAAGKSQSGS